VPKFSERSLKNLAECHPDLQRIAHEAIKEFDFVVIEGHRGQKEQNEAFARGTSQLRWPRSKHNKSPSLAFDACPYPIDWQARARFLEMRRVVQRVAARLGIGVRFISWDLPHLELTGQIAAKKVA
jgi:peptidoglycan L-alanyl-D-glutamate endopeptidase CwlK